MCEKLQAAIVNPSSVNLLSVEMADYSNPSLSSDDTLATSAASPVLEDASTNGSQEHIADSPLLLGGYPSTDEGGESEDGLNSHSLLGD